MTGLDEKLKARLPQLTLETLHQFDGGKLNRQFKRAMHRAVENISEFPLRNGKPESREITLRVVVTPVVKTTKRAMESAFGSVEVDVPEIAGLAVRCVIKDKLPIFESGLVNMAVEVRGGRITDARFNPNNSENPGQLELFEDDDPEDDDGDDSDDDNSDDSDESGAGGSLGGQ